jgi:hypothetical protein
MQAEEQRVNTIVIQWSAGASKKQNTRSTALQNRMNTLYDRYNNGLMNASNLLTGFSLLVGVKK